MAMTENVPPGGGEVESTTELVRKAIDDARELTRLEVALAKQEVFAELKALRTSAVVFGVGAVLAICGLSLLLVALAFALGGGLAALVIGVVCLALAGACGAYGWSVIPRHPLDTTKKRLEEDVEELRERVA